MKKLINFAVAAIMMTLCTVIFWNCSGSDFEGDPVRPVDPTVDEVLRNNCTENVVNTYTSDNAEIKTRSVVVPQGNYEALISAKSVHQFIVDILYKEDVPVKQDSVAYTVTNTVKGYGLKKTRFARSAKVFETWKEESKTLEDGRVVRAYTFNGEQGGEVFKLSTIDEQTCSDESVTIQGATFEDLCKNHWTDRKLVKVEPVYLEQDSADYKWYRIDFIFNDALAYGTDSKGTDNRKVEFTMHGEKVWIAKEGTNPPIPDDPEEVIAYTAKEKGFEFVKDSISAETSQKITVSKAWIQFEKLLSTGETKLSYRPEVLLYCRVDTPAIQTPVNVSDFEIKNLEAEKYSKIAYGDKEERGKNVFVQKYGQKITTKTNKAQFIFDGKSEEATCVDSLGIEHQFEFRTWDFVDLGTKLTDMEPQDGKERKLLTSTISATFNKRSAEYKGEAELIKLKDGQKKAGIDIINERPKIDGDKVVIEFDKENRYNDGSKDTIFNLTFDPNYRVTVEDPIAVKNRDYARKSNEAVKKLVKKEKTEVGTFTWQACQYSNTFEYVGFNNALQAYVPESVLYTDEELAETVPPIKPKQLLLRATLSGSDPTDPTDPDAIRYEYTDKGIRYIDYKTNYTYMKKTAVYSDGSKGKPVEIGVNIYNIVEVPTLAPQIVTDFNVTDQTPSAGQKVPSGENRQDGNFSIMGYQTPYVTRTNKTDFNFLAKEEIAVYVDEFGHEETMFHSDYSFESKPSETTKLPDQDGYERRETTSSIIAKYNAQVKLYSAQVELRKKAEEEPKTLKSVEYGNHGIDFKSGNTWNAWQEYTKIYSDNSRENAKKSVDLNYIVNPQASKDQIASEANAPYTGLTPGSSNSTTRSGGQNITVTTTNTVYTENYTIFNDTYTAVSEKAVYSEVEDGVEIKFNFDFVEIGNVAHSSDNLSNANQTKVVDGITYDIHAHTGVLGYSVASKNFTATCYTNVLVAQPVNPNVPESWGRVKGVAGHTLVFDPDFGTDGRFRDCWVINFENGKWVVLDNDWNDTSSFFGWDKCYNDNRLRSAVKFDDGTYFPSTCTIDGTGWSYVGEKIGGGSKVVDMSQQRALLAGIKNFTGDSTAEVTPERGGWGQASGNTLKVYTKDGLLVKTIITK